MTDTGQDPPENLGRVFDPFFTGFDVSRHSSGTFEYDRRGLGLGLSMAKTFVEMHGGTLAVASGWEKGPRSTWSCRRLCECLRPRLCLGRSYLEALPRVAATLRPIAGL